MADERRRDQLPSRQEVEDELEVPLLGPAAVDRLGGGRRPLVGADERHARAVDLVVRVDLHPPARAAQEHHPARIARQRQHLGDRRRGAGGLHHHGEAAPAGQRPGGGGQILPGHVDRRPEAALPGGAQPVGQEVDQDDRAPAGEPGELRRELPDQPAPEHGHGVAQRDAPEPHAVEADRRQAGEGGQVGREARRQRRQRGTARVPDDVAAMPARQADRLAGGQVADRVARGQHRPHRGVAGIVREARIRRAGGAEADVGAGINRRLGPGAHGAPAGFDQHLVRAGRVRQLELFPTRLAHPGECESPPPHWLPASVGAPRLPSPRAQACVRSRLHYTRSTLPHTIAVAQAVGRQGRDTRATCAGRAAGVNPIPFK